MTAEADLPNLVRTAYNLPDRARRLAPPLSHKQRILMLYGSLQERSSNHFLAFEGQRLLEAMGAEVRIRYPNGLPLPDEEPKIV